MFDTVATAATAAAALAGAVIGPFKTVGRFLVAVPALLTPVILLGGIYTGVFTPTEAAAIETETDQEAAK